jgi:hypothetical protein
MAEVTTQTKKFVDLADLLGFRLKCRTCYTELTVSLEEYAKKRSSAGFLTTCPICRTGWTMVDGGPSEPTFNALVESLQNVSALFPKTAPFPTGFLLSIELKDEPKDK